jgi:hypothetical protein
MKNILINENRTIVMVGNNGKEVKEEYFNEDEKKIILIRRI